MHGLNASFIPAFSPVDIPRNIASFKNIRGTRNLLPLSPSDAFGYNYVGDLRLLMRKLAARINRELVWPDVLPCAVNAEDNPTIPSGYTYLLQLIAHDMVDTSISLAATDGPLFGFENARVQALTLDTIFGGGPDVSPHAYELTQLCSQYRGLVPRTRLRAGRTQKNGSTADQPFNDIGRATPVDVQDSGIPNSAETQKCLRSEALLADPRNDDHAIISQLTLLFHRLHNYIIGVLENFPSDLPPAPKAYHSFIFARFIVTWLYRRIILYDVLRRLLDPSVFRYYVIEQNNLIANQESGVPVEFSYGAFRCGHAMVRDSYRVNDERPDDPPQDTIHALQQSSLRLPRFLPVNDVWTVSWKHFFPICRSTTPNFSRRLGPNFSPVTKNDMFFPALTASDTSGLPSRDLVSSVYAHMWSVPPLIEALRTKAPALASFLPHYTEFQAPLKNWLSAPYPVGIEAPLEPADVEALVADPPLPFFILFEAALTRESAIVPFTGGGRHLGPLGSIIVAEAILGAMQQHPLVVNSASIEPRMQIGDLTSRFEQIGIHREFFTDFPDIQSMPDLLNFMRERGALP